MVFDSSLHSFPLILLLFFSLLFVSLCGFSIQNSASTPIFILFGVGGAYFSPLILHHTPLTPPALLFSLLPLLFNYTHPSRHSSRSLRHSLYDNKKLQIMKCAKFRK
jgi:hypothetical protein